jgi:pimeloyl-ACP methyl ester carboxylesterase
MGDEVRDERIAMDGRKYFYRDWGDVAAPPIVLLHGFTGHARSWDTIARKLAATRRVIAFDQRGHGLSDWADEYSTTAMVEDMRLLVDSLGFDRFELLGLSMGGRVAFHFAGTYPDRVTRLVLVDIAPETNRDGAQRIQEGTRQQDVFATVEEAFAQSAKANPIAPAAEREHRVRNNLMRQQDGTWTFRYDRALRNGERPLDRPPADEGWAACRAITAPTLFIRGAQSDLITPGLASRMGDEIPACRVVAVDPSGHSVPLDNPEGFAAAVLPFVNGD